MTSVLISCLLTLRGIAQSRVAIHLEVLALRHQLQVLQRSRPRPSKQGKGEAKECRKLLHASPELQDFLRVPMSSGS